jgi:Rrf2 family protein
MSATALEKEMGVSAKYLERIMRMLSEREIIEAERGASGGYKLAQKPAQITVGDIVRTLEDDMEIVSCIASPCCKCASGNVWRRLYDEINAVLDKITLQSMIDENYGNMVNVCNETGKNGQVCKENKCKG